MKQFFDAAHAEKYWCNFWLENRYFDVEKNSEGQGVFSMVIPPPNVTGTLHMGHAFQLSIMDALARYHRMKGDRVLWQLGTDHAGIATQLVVENLLKIQGKDRLDLGREAFIQEVWKWKESSAETIINQQKRLGISGDWERLRFTLDQPFSQAVVKVFVQLYQEGLIYRGKKLVNWDPVLKTAISDLEVVNEEEDGFIWYIRYPLDKEHFLVVATTRPETIFGDTALAVHPEDPRFRSFVGLEVNVPLGNRKIPVITDEYVDREFGSGCVKITPAHDFNDYQVGERHQLPLINIFNPDATLNQAVPLSFQGLGRLEARERVVDSLKEQGLLLKIEPHRLKIPRGDRTREVLEPYLTEQWFLKMESLAGLALRSLQEGELHFIPENWGKTYIQWLENIEDWCISRQLWWGHQIPAWWDKAGNFYVGESEGEVRERFHLTGELTRDADVLDTWFSAAMWPFVTLGWLENSRTFRDYYPTSVLVTGFDIIFFWVARMAMFGLKFTQQLPFNEVYITGLVRDAHGQKMSKSKGNVLDPLDLIDGISLEDLITKRTQSLIQKHLKEQIISETKKEFPEGIKGYGVDALRFTLASLTTPNRNINFEMKRLVGYRNFVTKIWNAARFILGVVEKKELGQKEEQLDLMDHWILAKFNRMIQQIEVQFKRYRFDLIAQELYDFMWYQFCDWYLEFAKIKLRDANNLEALKKGTYTTLIRVMESFLRALHPFMPFVTEELWQLFGPLLGAKEQSIMLVSYPVVVEALEQGETVEWLQQLIVAIRNLRNNFTLPGMSDLYVKAGTAEDRVRLREFQPYLSLAKIGQVIWEKVPDSTHLTVTCGSLELAILVDPGVITKEQLRLESKLEQLELTVTNLTIKLKNASYIERASPSVVSRDKVRLGETEELVRITKQQLAYLIEYVNERK